MNLIRLFVVILIVQISHPAQTHKRHIVVRNLQITNLGKKIIVLAILRRVDNNELTFKNNENKEALFVSTKNLPNLLFNNALEKFKANNGVTIIFVSPSEIANETNIKFNYLEFSSFKIIKNQAEVIAEWYFSGEKREVYTYVFTKIGNRWKGRLAELYRIPFDELPPARPGIMPTIKLPTENDLPQRLKSLYCRLCDSKISS